MLKKIDSNLINKIIFDSQTAPRRRARSNFHQNNEIIQRMVVAFQKDAYIQPHKHQNPDKLEVFICLKGRFLAICFDTSGAIIDHAVFGEKEGPITLTLNENEVTSFNMKGKEHKIKFMFISDRPERDIVEVNIDDRDYFIS